MTKIGSGPGMVNKLYRGSFMDSLHANSERGRFIGNLVNPSRGLGEHPGECLTRSQHILLCRSYRLYPIYRRPKAYRGGSHLYMPTSTTAAGAL